MIRLVDVRKRYRNAASGELALRGVSLEIETGELVAIVGTSGSGKTRTRCSFVWIQPPPATSIPMTAYEHNGRWTFFSGRERAEICECGAGSYGTRGAARSVLSISGTHFQGSSSRP